MTRVYFDVFFKRQDDSSFLSVKKFKKRYVSFSKYYEVFHILLNLDITKVFILNDFEIIITIEIL